VGERTVRAQIDEATGIAVVEFDHRPANFFDTDLIRRIADAYDEVGADPSCRVVVLMAGGRHFCAGADLFDNRPSNEDLKALYEQAVRLFEVPVPVVAAVQGRAVGGGLGLALSADFRVAAPETQFVCNFSRLGFHHGFGLSITLPRLIGQQRALEMLYTGGEASGERARAIGLCDRLVPVTELRAAALDFASEIAAAGPLAVRAIRQTMRGRLADEVRAATAIEHRAQASLSGTEDFAEGVRAVMERRQPRFVGR